MIQQDIQGMIPAAMKAKDEVRLRTLRGLVSSFTNELLTLKRKPTDALSDDEVLAVIRRQVKQRKDSIEQFTAGNRPDLVETEQAELAVLEAFLPAMMGKDEIRKVAEAKKAELGVTDKSKMGVFMGAVMKELKGKADGADVKEVIESLF